MIDDLESMLCAATGYDAISLQPNAGSQGEYAGLLAIRGYHESRGDSPRAMSPDSKFCPWYQPSLCTDVWHEGGGG